MVGGGILDDETLVALDALEFVRLLDRPLTNVSPFLLLTLRVFLGMRGLPSRLPIIGELL